MPAPPPTSAAPDPLEPLRRTAWLSEAQRKALHISFILLPLTLLFDWLPWPRGKGEWRLALAALTVLAVVVDVVRIHDHRVTRFFSRFFGELIREHEKFNLLGSTYLLLAALLAGESFPRPVAGP